MAVKEQARTGKRLGEVLVSLGFCKECDISQVGGGPGRGEDGGPVAPPAGPAAMQLIDKEFAKRQQAGPLS